MVNTFSSFNLSTQTGVTKVKADYDNKNAGIGGLDNAVSWSTSGTSGGMSVASSGTKTNSPAPSAPPSAPKDFSALEASDDAGNTPAPSPQVMFESPTLGTAPVQIPQPIAPAPQSTGVSPHVTAAPSDLIGPVLPINPSSGANPSLEATDNSAGNSDPRATPQLGAPSQPDPTPFKDSQTTMRDFEGGAKDAVLGSIKPTSASPDSDPTAAATSNNNSAPQASSNGDQTPVNVTALQAATTGPITVAQLAADLLSGAQKTSGGGRNYTDHRQLADQITQISALDPVLAESVRTNLEADDHVNAHAMGWHMGSAAVTAETGLIPIRAGDLIPAQQQGSGSQVSGFKFLGRLVKLGSGVSAGLALFFHQNSGKLETHRLSETVKITHHPHDMPQVQVLHDGVWDTAAIAITPTGDGFAIDLKALENVTGLKPSDFLEDWQEGFSTTPDDDTPTESFPIDDDPFPNSTGGAPDDPGLDTHTGHAPEDTSAFDGPLITPLPEETGPSIVDMGRKNKGNEGDFTTPAGNVIQNHGNLDGETYIAGKGQTDEQIDEIIANPVPELSGYIKGTGAEKGKDVRLLIGDDGHWVKVNEEGKVIQTSNRNVKASAKDNDIPELLGPLN